MYYIKVDDILINDGILKDKNILILVTGSIAIYKTLDLISRLKKDGANIAVVMTDSAIRFINPLCFEAMSGRDVLHSNSECYSGANYINHISYAKWADIALVAPASVNILAKIRHGISDNIVVTTVLALKVPVLLAPSANVNMIESRQNRDNIDGLIKMGYVIINPRVSLLACNVIANGAMAEVDEIVFNLKKHLLSDSFWLDKEVIVTGGGSIERIDLVRCISNYSSAKQASFIALVLYYLGAKVTFISSKFPINLPLDIHCVEVEDSKDYFNALGKCNRDSILIMAAAISDYTFLNPFDKKLKKEDLGEVLNLQFMRNIDILREVDFRIKVGFKAENSTTQSILNARKLLNSKNSGGKDCDIVVLNHIDDNKIGGDYNEMVIVTHNKEIYVKKSDKFSISFELVSLLKEEIKNIRRINEA